MLDHLSTKRIDWQKPRKEGITYIVDKFQDNFSANRHRKNLWSSTPLDFKRTTDGTDKFLP